MKFAGDIVLRDGEITLRQVQLDPGDPARKWVPACHFSIFDSAGTEVGGCNLRLGHSDELYYAGNIGYRIDPAHRGRHYAGKACKLLFELAKRHGMDYLIITCNPDNWPSRRTCDYLGGELLEIAALPEDNEMRARNGETHKCVYRFSLH